MWRSPSFPWPLKGNCLADPIFSQLFRKVFLNEDRINKCQLLARVQVPIVWIEYICLERSGVSFISPQHSLAVSMLISLPCPAVGLLQSVGKCVAPSRRARAPLAVIVCTVGATLPFIIIKHLGTLARVTDSSIWHLILVGTLIIVAMQASVPDSYAKMTHRNLPSLAIHVMALRTQTSHCQLQLVSQLVFLLALQKRSPILSH